MSNELPYARLVKAFTSGVMQAPQRWRATEQLRVAGECVRDRALLPCELEASHPYWTVRESQEARITADGVTVARTP